MVEGFKIPTQNAKAAQPLISAIVPVYNGEDHLGRCIESLLAQTYKNLEIVVVDDGSTDSSLSLCRKYQSHDSRIKVFHQDNKGLSGARNTGVAAATGDYYYFIDCDDYLEETTIERLLLAAERCGASIAVGNLVYVDANRKVLKELIPPTGNYNAESFWAMIYRDENRPLYPAFIVACGKLFAASVFEGELFDTGKIHEDEFISHRLFDRADTIVLVPDAFYYYVQHDKSIMHNRSEKSYLDAAEAFLLRASYFEAKGWFLELHGVLRQARGVLRTAYSISDGQLALRFSDLCRQGRALSIRDIRYGPTSLKGRVFNYGFFRFPSLCSSLMNIIGK